MSESNSTARKPEDYDEETLRVMLNYAGRDLFSARRIPIEVFSAYGEEWTLPEFLAAISDAIEEIPEEFRDQARVVHEGDEFSSFRILYERPQTVDEINERVDRAYEYACARIVGERRTYEELKAKFEGGS